MRLPGSGASFHEVLVDRGQSYASLGTLFCAKGRKLGIGRTGGIAYEDCVATFGLA